MINQKIIINIIITICISQSLFADIRWELFLKDISVNDIAFEGEYIWCATSQYGVMKFDKRNGDFIKYSIEDGLHDIDIFSVAVDRKGVKWFGGVHYGICNYDGEHWHRFTKEETGVGDRSGTLAIYDITVDNDDVKWFVTELGVISFNDTTWKYLQTTPDIAEINVDKNNTVWICGGSYLKRIDNESSHVFSEEDLRKLGFGDLAVCKSTIAIDNNLHVWVGGDGLAQYDGITWTVYSEEFISDSIRFNPGYIYSIKVGTDNVKYLGTGSGLISFDGAEFREYIFYNDSTGTLKYFTPWITDIELDGNGDIWAAVRVNYHDYIVDEYGLVRYYYDYSQMMEDESPVSFGIQGIYPNPFNTSTTITVTLPVSCPVSLVIYNLSGQKVREIVSQSMVSGDYSFVWNGANDGGSPVSSGLYFARLNMDGKDTYKKMMLLR